MDRKRQKRERDSDRERKNEERKMWRGGNTATASKRDCKQARQTAEVKGTTHPQPGRTGGRPGGSEHPRIAHSAAGGADERPHPLNLSILRVKRRRRKEKSKLCREKGRSGQERENEKVCERER